MGHVFISYSTKNSEYALKLADKLRHERFDVWIDNTKLRTSEDWWESIVKALWSCDAFIVLVSPEANESKWVQREITIADQRNKPTFPIVIGGDLNLPNWQIFVRTQADFHTDGSLPDTDFFDKLATKANRGTGTGRDMTANKELVDAVDTTDALSADIADKPDEVESPDVPHTTITQDVSASDDAKVHVVGQQTIGNQTNIENQHMGEQQRTWNSAVIVTTIIGIISVVFAGLALVPNWVDIQVGLGFITQTPILTETSPPSTSVSQQSSPTSIAIPQTGTAGAFDITLIYGEQNSFTIKVNGESSLSGITLNTSNRDVKNLMSDFPDLSLLRDTIKAGTCLIYEREQSRPLLPLGCSENQVYRLGLPSADVFWFNQSTNQYVNIILSRGDELTQLCSHDNGSGRCDISATE